MGEIAKSAGVSKGTLYIYFDSKEALFEALILEERPASPRSCSGSTRTIPTRAPCCAAWATASSA